MSTHVLKITRLITGSNVNEHAAPYFITWKIADSHRIRFRIAGLCIQACAEYEIG